MTFRSEEICFILLAFIVFRFFCNNTKQFECSESHASFDLIRTDFPNDDDFFSSADFGIGHTFRGSAQLIFSLTAKLYPHVSTFGFDNLTDFNKNREDISIAQHSNGNIFFIIDNNSPFPKLIQFNHLTDILDQRPTWNTISDISIPSWNGNLSFTSLAFDEMNQLYVIVKMGSSTSVGKLNIFDGALSLLLNGMIDTAKGIAVGNSRVYTICGIKLCYYGLIEKSWSNVVFPIPINANSLTWGGKKYLYLSGDSVWRISLQDGSLNKVAGVPAKASSITSICFDITPRNIVSRRLLENKTNSPPTPSPGLGKDLVYRGDAEALNTWKMWRTIGVVFVSCCALIILICCYKLLPKIGLDNAAV